MEIKSYRDSLMLPELTSEVGLAGIVEKQLSRYINVDRQTPPPSGLYDRVIHEVERPLLRLVLNLAQGNKIKAAKILGLNRNTLLKKLRFHGLAPTTPDIKIKKRKSV